jgi:hypothetical protein
LFGSIFTGSILTLHQGDLLDPSIFHGKGITTAAKKGGDNIGYSKKMRGDKIVAFCDRNYNVNAAFVSAPSNRDESPPLKEALPQLTRIAKAISLVLKGFIVSLDGIYDFPLNRKAIFNRGMVPNIKANPRATKGSKRYSTSPFSKSGSIPSSRFSPGKTN